MYNLQISNKNSKIKELGLCFLSIECHPCISKLYTLTWYYQNKFIPKFKHTGPGFLKTSAIAIKNLTHRFFLQ